MAFATFLYFVFVLMCEVALVALPSFFVCFFCCFTIFYRSIAIQLCVVSGRFSWLVCIMSAQTSTDFLRYFARSLVSCSLVTLSCGRH